MISKFNLVGDNKWHKFVCQKHEFKQRHFGVSSKTINFDKTLRIVWSIFLTPTRSFSLELMNKLLISQASKSLKTPSRRSLDDHKSVEILTVSPEFEVISFESLLRLCFCCESKGEGVWDSLFFIVHILGLITMNIFSPLLTDFRETKKSRTEFIINYYWYLKISLFTHIHDEYIFHKLHPTIWIYEANAPKVRPYKSSLRIWNS